MLPHDITYTFQASVRRTVQQLLLGENMERWESHRCTARELIDCRPTLRDLRRFKDALAAKEADPSHTISCGPRQGAYALDLNGTLNMPWNVEARKVFIRYHFSNKRPSISEQKEAMKGFNTYFWTLRREFRRYLATGDDSELALETRLKKAQKNRTYRVSYRACSLAVKFRQMCL